MRNSTPEEKDKFRALNIKHLLQSAGAPSTWEIFEKYYQPDPLFLGTLKKENINNSGYHSDGDNNNNNNNNNSNSVDPRLESPYETTLREYQNLPKALQIPPVRKIYCIYGKN
jgi:hypothetical protein